LSRCDGATAKATPASDDEQALAIEHCMTHRLTMIAGGPGTGKTTTVTRLLARWLAEGHTANEIALMAPTGKAANRLNQSLASAIDRLDLDPAIRQSLQTLQASTIHRGLKYTAAPPERGGPFRHTRSNPLHAGLIVVDEASMIDMELMSYLFAAIGPRAHVVLLGDPDQLVSVEAGCVFGDLVADDSLAAGSVAKLTVSHRFGSGSDLGQLARAIRDGDAGAAIELLRNGEGNIQWFAEDDPAATAVRVVELAAELYSPYLKTLAESPDDAALALGEFNRFRVLCATHHSWRGDHRMNRAIADRLTTMGLLPPDGVGRPVMVQTNAYRQGLYNGDTGIIVRDSAGELQAIMEGRDACGGPRIVPAGLLPPAGDAWAETIHKSQGSEFHQVMVLLPEACSGLVSRELLYTAVTRACDEGTQPGRLVLVGSEAVVRHAIDTRVQRHSNLRRWTK
jgi:exodeoxyribonuclease V alpha subunit